MQILIIQQTKTHTLNFNAINIFKYNIINLFSNIKKKQNKTMESFNKYKILFKRTNFNYLSKHNNIVTT